LHLPLGPDGQQRPRLAGRELAAVEAQLDRVRQLEQAQRVRHGGAALAQPDREVLVGQPRADQQRLVGGGLVERAQVLALDVLDQGQLEGRDVVGIQDHRRDRLALGQAGGPHAALAGDQREAGRAALDDDRLQDPVVADRRGQPEQRLVVEGLARLVRVRADLGQRDLHHRRPVRRLTGATDQGVQPPSETAFLHGEPPNRPVPATLPRPRARSQHLARIVFEHKYLFHNCLWIY